MGTYNKFLMLSAAMIASCPDNVYHTRDFNRDQYRLQTDTNNYKANENLIIKY